jgi:hypothetical protein
MIDDFTGASLELVGVTFLRRDDNDESLVRRLHVPITNTASGPAKCSRISEDRAADFNYGYRTISRYFLRHLAPPGRTALAPPVRGLLAEGLPNAGILLAGAKRRSVRAIAFAKANAIAAFQRLVGS